MGFWDFCGKREAVFLGSSYVACGVEYGTGYLVSRFGCLKHVGYEES